MMNNLEDQLTRLRDEFDRDLAQLRAPDAGKKLRETYGADPQEIADAANAETAAADGGAAAERQ